MKAAIAAACVLMTVAACGGATPNAASTPTGTPSETGASTSTQTGTPTATPTGTTPPAGPPPTGGSVLIGDIASAKSFDPKPVLVAAQDKFLDCYNQGRATNPELRGKLRLRTVVNSAGTVVNVDAEEGGMSKEAGLIACLTGVLKATPFPKPGGMATVTVPMLFRP